MASLRYRADIDGLRALAVLPVLFFHAKLAGFSGGYIGVDVFFVISGFLITTILHKEMSQGTFSVARFYERRIRRLWPAIGGLTLATLIGALLLLPPVQLRDFGQSLVAVAMFGSNVLFYLEAGYFAGPAELKPLLHTWSLAVEEQFYVFFPAFLWACHRWLPRRITAAVVAAAVLSFVASLLFMKSDGSLVFYMLPFRAWELLLGSLLAVVRLPTLSIGWASGVGWLGILLVAVCFPLYDSSTPFPGWAAVPPCLGTALVIHAGRTQGALSARVLGLAPLVFVGKISYSLYLWHWPLLVFARVIFDDDLVTNLGAAALSIVAGTLSWRFVEQPFRRPGSAGGRRAVFAGALAVSAAWVGAGVALHVTRGLPGRLSPAAASFAEAAEDFSPGAERCGTWSEAEGVCVIGDLDAGPPSFTFWGDSHAAILVHGIDQAARQAGRSGLMFVEPSCPPLFGVTKDDDVMDDREDARCPEQNRRVLALHRRLPSLRTVVLAARWPLYTRERGVGLDGEHVVTLAADNGSAEPEDVFAHSFEATLERLRAEGLEVFVLAPIPEMPMFDARSLSNRLVVHGEAARPEIERRGVVSREEVTARAAAFEAALAPWLRTPGVHRLDPLPLFCDDARCRATETATGRPRYPDNNHVTTTMSRSMAELWAPVFASKPTPSSD